MPAKKKTDAMNWIEIKEKIPRSIEVEFEGKSYKFNIWKEFSPTQAAECLCAQGPSAEKIYGDIGIQIPRMFGIRTMESLREHIICGFRNQKIDQERLRARNAQDTSSQDS